MNWIACSLLSAFFDSFFHILSKNVLKANSHYVVSILMSFFTALICGVWAYFKGIPPLDVSFFKMAALASVMGSTGLLCFMKGLKKSDISFAIPLLCFGPIFTALWEWLFLSSSMTQIALLGVLIVLIGTYSMELDQVKNGYLAPVKALYVNSGARLVFLASFIWSLSSIIDKVGVLNTNAVIWTGVVNLFMAVFLFFIGLLSKNIRLSKEITFHPKESSKNLLENAFASIATRNTLLLFATSLFFALMLVFQMRAFSLTNVAYVLSLKRASILLSVLAGFFFFNEKKIKERLLATVIMIFGGVLIILFA